MAVEAGALAEQRRRSGWQPGQSGNPAGNPNGGRYNVTSAVARRLARRAFLSDAIEILGDDAARYFDQDGRNLVYGDILAGRIVMSALRGNQKMVEIVWQYMNGKPQESVEITGNVQNVLTVEGFRSMLTGSTGDTVPVESTDTPVDSVSLLVAMPVSSTELDEAY